MKETILKVENTRAYVYGHADPQVIGGIRIFGHTWKRSTGICFGTVGSWIRDGLDTGSPALGEINYHRAHVLQVQTGIVKSQNICSIERMCQALNLRSVTSRTAANSTADAVVNEIKSLSPGYAFVGISTSSTEEQKGHMFGTWVSEDRKCAYLLDPNEALWKYAGGVDDLAADLKGLLEEKYEDLLPARCDICRVEV